MQNPDMSSSGILQKLSKYIASTDSGYSHRREVLAKRRNLDYSIRGRYPDEGIWKHFKCVELKNLCCESLAELREELRKAKERLRHKSEIILGCIRQPGFEV